MSDQSRLTIGIVGAGIAGLAAAWQLVQRKFDAEILLWESDTQPGGLLQTVRADEFLVETSADMFSTEPAFALDLCRQLGREDQLLSTTPVEQRAYVATADGMEPVPHGLSLLLPTDVDSILESKLLDEAGKRRFLEEESIPPKTTDVDESLKGFAIRRFGEQVFDQLIQPLVSGIYTADPEKLSMKSTLSRFLELEKKHGSLISAGKAARNTEASGIHADQQASGARYDLFRAPVGGMAELIGWLVDRLAAQTNVNLFCEHPVKSISPYQSGWHVSVNQSQSFVDRLIVAVPSAIAGQLVTSFDSELGDRLQEIRRASCAVITIGFDHARSDWSSFRGYGIVIPSCLKRRMIAASFSSNKFPGRAPKGHSLVRCFIGGALQESLVDLSDEELVSLALEELEMLNGTVPSPKLARVYRWRNAMPQYHLGHMEKVAEIETRLKQWSGLSLIGNSYHGVGIPVCIQSGINAANAI